LSPQTSTLIGILALLQACEVIATYFLAGTSPTTRTWVVLFLHPSEA